MPIFEYRCATCGERFERLVRGAEAPGSCPACESTEVEKLLSLPSVRSEQTRQRATADRRSRTRAIRGEQERAEIRRIEAHSQDHAD
jgi:putative FmdB family regulatory protein